MLKKILEYIYKNLLSILSLLTGFFVKDIQKAQGNDPQYNFRRALVKIAFMFVIVCPMMYSLYVIFTGLLAHFIDKDLLMYFQIMGDKEHLGLIFRYVFCVVAVVIILYHISLIADKISTKTINESVEKVSDAVADKIKH